MTILHPALLQESGWKYSKRVRDLKAAHWWGCPSPGFFDALPKAEKIDVIALYEIDWRIEAINSYEANEKAKRAAAQSAKKSGTGGRKGGHRPRRR